MSLRALEPSDLDLLYEVENDQSLWSVADAPAFYSRFALWKYIQEQPRDFRESGELRLVFEADVPALSPERVERVEPLEKVETLETIEKIETVEKSEAVEAKRPAAFLDLTNYSPSDDRAEVSIAVFSAFRGRGLGLKALNEIEQYARQYLHLHQLYAQVAAARNEPAHRLFLAAGYRRTATLTAWHRLGDTYEDIAVYQKQL